MLCFALPSYHAVQLLGGIIDIANVHRSAKQQGLEVAWHEIWQYQDGQPPWKSFILYLLGQLPSQNLDGLRILEFLESTKEHCVFYADQCREFNVWSSPYARFQTFSRSTRNGPFNVSYNAFVAMVKQLVTKPRITFDTQHVLEWYHGVANVSGLISHKQTLDQDLYNCWADFHPYTDEIHLNNLVLNRGDELGHHVLPWNGVLHLKEFTQHVLDTSHQEELILTPEPDPGNFLWGNPEPLLRKLNDMVREYCV